jgi:hypothetical protein
VAAIVAPWDRNPILARVERARVVQLVQRHAREQEIDETTLRYETELAGLRTELAGLRTELERRDEALAHILRSRSFALAERLSRLRRPGGPRLSREEIGRMIESEGTQG